jgi:hypothetical protein
MSPRLPHMEDELIPLTAAEFEMNIKIHVAAMRARKEVGAMREVHPNFAKRLVERLWRSGFRPFQRRNDPMQAQFDPHGSERD